MIKESDEVYATLTINWESGEGNVFVNGDLFMKDETTSITMLEDWISCLSQILHLIRTNATTPKKEKKNV